MIFRTATRVFVVMAATAALAQSALPGTTPASPMLSQQDLAARRGPARNRAAATPQGLAAIQQQVEDMDHTVSQMRVVLKQMQVRAAKSKATDSVTKANLDMWELMMRHMDKELQELRSTLAVREDMEARRAALYKQADAKIEAQAQAARAAQAARFAEASKNATGTQTPSAASPQTAPAQSSTVSPASNPASPN